MNHKLRLLLWEDCGKSCPGCCNKDWKLKELPIVTNFSYYQEIILTGGEPMLYPDLLQRVIGEIMATTFYNPKIYLYTANTKNIDKLINILLNLSGITITLHDPEDIEDFIKFIEELNKMSRNWLNDKSLRLHIFKEAEVGDKLKKLDLPGTWDIKEGIEWIDNCPLPKDEEFKRYWM